MPNPAPTAYPVFLSVTTPYTPPQTEFVGYLEARLAEAGLVPTTLRRSDWSFEAPLVPIRDLMRSCCGTVIVALVRTVVRRGVTWPGGPEQAEFEDRYQTTAWTQIEGAMAFQMGQPLWVLKEAAIAPEGILNPASGDHVVQSLSLDGGVLRLPNDFDTALAAFRDRVIRYASHAHGDRP